MCSIQNPAQPTDPQLIYKQPMDDVVVLSDLAYVVGYVPVDYGDYVANRHGFGIIEVSSGNVIGSYESPSVVHSLYVAGNYTYLATLDGLEIIDITDPYHPMFVGQYSSHDMLCVSVKGNYVYAGVSMVDGGHFQVIDVSSPTNPSLVKDISVWGDVYSISISGNRAFVSSQELNMFDITNPVSPKLLANYSLVYNGRADADQAHVICTDYDAIYVFEYQ